LEASGLPGWVYKRDGRLVPFEADKISQALFAAAEAVGRPDPFLARELTDSVLHFLEREFTGTKPTTTQVAELIVKVVRELGQPELSQSYAHGNRRRLRSGTAGASAAPEPPAEAGDIAGFRFSLGDSPATVTRNCLREYSLQAIFSRDLVAAHREGLLTLLGLETPLGLAGCVFDLTGEACDGNQEKAARAHSRRSGALVQGLLDTRRRAGSFLAIDGPEYALTPFASAGDLAKNSGELAAGLEATGLAVIINLNCSRRPTWADEQTEGPLFAGVRQATPAAHVEEYRTVLLEQLVRPGFAGRVRIDWHLGEHDFPPGGIQADARLFRLVRWAADSASLSFTFDRASYPVSLAEGIDRKHPAVLMAVGLNLPRLLDTKTSTERFLLKLASLSRMAVSAAVQKKSFLRRHAESQDLARGFLLDRAWLVVVPIGLHAAVTALTRQGRGGENGSTLGAQIVSSLCANLRQAGHAASLDVTADGPCWSTFARAGGFSVRDDSSLPNPDQVAGVTCWAAHTDLKAQLKASDALHAAAEAGTAAVLIPHDQPPAAEELVALLQYAWQRTHIARLRFVRLPHQQQQLAW
jgi:hypothetical protein